MTNQLFHHTFCACGTQLVEAVRTAARTAVGNDRATVECPECGAVITYKLHWEVTYAEELERTDGADFSEGDIAQEHWANEFSASVDANWSRR